MAALCPGVQYGLSSQGNFGENKDLIFVKLTDSALCAIKEYIRNQGKLTYQSPTIKFLGNEGQLSFPSHNGGCNSFNFSMSSTADMEGPGGSFECVHQTAPPRGLLEALGSIPHKIRIHANDDVYETTRHRMTVADELQKNKCTREIKPNQTDIGRKVKVKQNRNAILPVRKEPPPPVRESLPPKPSYPLNNVPSKLPVHSSTGNSLSNGLGSNHVSSSKPHQNKPLVPDIAKRPIKERLIHLLALRPFKKVELYERLSREGLRERNSMTSVLRNICAIKDNCFYLKRALWNEVHDDWPFYTEQEKLMVKRQRPQNLTPPGGSDGGSSGSGQSPTSTHPGSPPQPNNKRPHENSAADIIPTKRQRISHYRKPFEQITQSPVENNSQRRPATDSRDASNMNPRSRESPVANGYPGPTTGNGYPALNDKRNLSDDENNANRNRYCDSHSLSFGVNREKTFVVSRSSSPFKSADDGRKEVLGDRNEIRNEPIERNSLVNGIVNGRSGNNEELRDKDRNKYSSKVSLTQNRIVRVSPDSQSSELVTTSMDCDQIQVNGEQEKKEAEEPPDYIIEFPPITNDEQRRQYKTLFNANYAEYKELHGVVEKVSRRFAALEECLKKENSKTAKHKDLKKQIVKEYQENKNDLDFLKAKQRFQYLHEKLSHLKRLVSDYDQQHLNRY